MGLTKTEGYTEEQVELSIVLKSLAHPARLAIVAHLMSVDSCICGDIVDVLPLSQPTISQHLKELKSAGIIKGKVEGNAICYCIDQNGFDLLKRFIGNVDASLLKSGKCC